MCGVLGILAYRGAGGVTPDILSPMRDSMEHRGPDGGGLWVSEDKSVGLAHRRLSILDLSALADQPMPNESRDVWLTYNGEVYNHASLRPVLAANGHIFKTDHSDTEVLVHGFEEWGMEGLLSRISGDYAFGIYDCRDQSLNIARDRIGVKPLYFAEFGGHFIFASEIKAILMHPLAERDIDPLAMVHYLSFLSTPAPMTMFKGIYKLPAGCWLKVRSDGSLQMHRYYSVGPGRGIDPSETRNLSDAAKQDFYVGGIRRRLHDSVERRMMSDVPYGVFLSGGVDSSTNVALMSRFSDQPIRTFTVGFKDHTDLNEMHYARVAATTFKTDHHEVLIDEDDMIGYLQNLVHHQDEPLADWVCIPLYFVSKLAHDNGVTVVQVGEGADEQFCGYDGYMKYLKLRQKFWSPFKSLPQMAQNAAASAAVWSSQFHPKLPVYADIIDRAARDREHFWILSMSIWNTSKDRFINYSALQSNLYHERMVEAGVLDPSYLVPDSYNVIKSFSRDLKARAPNADVLAGMTYNEFQLRLPELLLMRVDKIGMSVSLEPRVPFLDHELVDFTFDIPEKWKTKDGVTKYLLKKAVEGIIPDELIYRKKMGFNAPMAQWLKGSFGHRVEREILQSGLMQRGFFKVDFITQMFSDLRRNRANFSQQIWTIYNLVAWFDYWIEPRRQAAA